MPTISQFKTTMRPRLPIDAVFVRPQSNRGFSIAELSVVLVILGLLAGGVLSGRHLIRAAEVRSVAEDLERYATATYAFEDKYLALPGDMDNATTYWGKDMAVCPGDSGGAKVPGTCNGDGNQAVHETWQFWKQLALAGLIPGSYTGKFDPTYSHGNPGKNAPASRIRKAVFSVFSWDNTGNAADPYNFAVDYGNHFGFWVGSTLQAVSPQEIWNIDTKIDDGLPARGKLINIFYADCTTAVDATSFDAQYKPISDKAFLCSFRYRLNQ